MIRAETPDAWLFPGALAPFRSTLTWDDAPSTPVLDRPALLDVLARFQRSVEGAWQPACSLWAQLHFNTLLIPVTCLLADDPDRMVRVAAVSTSVCLISGTPLRCVLQTTGTDFPRGSAGSGLADCLIRHISAVIADLNAVSRLSKGLLRESAERVFAWTLHEIELADPARARAAKTLLAEASRFSASLSIGYAPAPVRRFCCLRDQLPTVPSCGDTCPRGNDRLHLRRTDHRRQACPGPRVSNRDAPRQ